jgi:hypothetical protein
MSSIGFSNDQMRYQVYGCDDFGDQCELLDVGYSDALIERYELANQYRIATNASRTGKGLDNMIGGISTATGQGIDIVRGMVMGIRETASNAGFNSFEGKLTGNDVSVSFSFHFESGVWNFSASGQSDPIGGPDLELGPSFGNE